MSLRFIYALPLLKFSEVNLKLFAKKKNSVKFYYSSCKKQKSVFVVCFNLLFAEYVKKILVLGNM